MPEFLELVPPPDALQCLLEALPEVPPGELIPTQQALGRVTSAPVVAPHPLPSFPRSTVDGFAVIAADTYGASDTLPAYLTMVGEVPMGERPTFALRQGECALIHTGGMLPEKATAVVMVEHTQAARQGEVEILRPAGEGENVLKVGEDVQQGEVVIPPGVRIRPVEIGGLMALGLTTVQVARKPRVGILSSGDEVVPPQMELGPGQVRDVNAYTLAALVEQAGGEPVLYGIIPDRADELRRVAGQALAECQAVVITAGSSASTRDLTATVIDSLGKPGVLVHGVNVRPGKPTILGVSNGVAMIGLPGNPVSALVIASLFVAPLIEALLGMRAARLRPRVEARLAINLASQTGREDWIPVQLSPVADGYRAEPIFGKSNLIFTLQRADGLLRIAPDATGLPAGEMVTVWLV